MTMKTNTITRFVLTLMLLAMAMPAFAQLTPLSLLSNTTLNGAINATQTTLVLTSASASSGSSYGAPSVGQCLFVDYELMRITAVASTTMTVQRARANPAPHATLAIVATGPCDRFKTVDPYIVGNGSCTSSPVLPWYNTATGDAWWCDLVSNVWSVTNPSQRNGTAGSRRVAQ
jgi:hypothetical protein